MERRTVTYTGVVAARARLLARLALLCAAAAIVSLFVPFGSGGLLIIGLGLAGLVLCAAGTWWFLAHRGPVRLLGALLAAGTPVGVLLLYVDGGLWRSALIALGLWAAALLCARSALRRPHRPRAATPAPRPRRPVLFMNPRSGGGKVERFGLVEYAERLGARVVLLDGGEATEERTPQEETAGRETAGQETSRRETAGQDTAGLETGHGAAAGSSGPEQGAAAGPSSREHRAAAQSRGSRQVDVAALARQAVADGADLLGVAGGDGTQALVAAVAAEHDLPFLVISAGTRNHFAMDLGLDRDDPARCLDALTDGEELRVDLGDVAGRAFVNTVSFGVYADVVQRPEYRDAKAGTALSVMPDLLTGDGGRRFDAVVDGTTLPDQQALLVSNNPYDAPADPLGSGRRPRLDRGVLGVIAVRVEGAAQAAELAVRGAQSPGLNILAARRVEVTAATGTLPVAVDGEALVLPTPVVCTLRPHALRVRVPRDRPGTVPPAPPLRWRRIVALAFGPRGETR
ncbi:diacylglycerol kinase family protein [Streptomyces sp. NPDC126499]|uniref:diacylglycerol/lipid kinase family protein n=1 Tax=Streptomyces sp. NPDC126499 TaxID=3155314 RepID=UPI00331A53E0